MHNRQIVAVCIGKFAVLSTLYFFLTWFPTCLLTERHISTLKTGALSGLLFIAASLGVLCGGALSDWLLPRGVALGTARKTPIVAGLLGVPSMVLAIFVQSDAAVIAIGYIVRASGSFPWALVLISAFAVLGALSYTFVLGEVRRIEIDAPPPHAGPRA